VRSFLPSAPRGVSGAKSAHRNRARQQGYRKRVTERERRRGARRRRTDQGAGFLRDVRVECTSVFPGKRRSGLPVTAMSFAPRLLIRGMIVSSSSIGRI